MPIVRSEITNMSTTASYWCYRCTRFITISPETTFVCPHCHGGFIEAVDSSRRIRRRRHLFNPVIVLRSPSHETQHSRTFDLYYDDGAGSGLRRVPAPISEFLMVSGFDRLLEHLSQIGLARPENPPASKAAIESIPTVEINHSHVSAESHCAVCMEQFEFGSEAREMPCQHIYHPECILPWLSLRNSCPVCRHELPADNSQSEDPTEGLTIWRLPGGGFAVGRFTGGRRGVGSELPAVYTEMDGGFNDGGAPRRVVSGSRRSTGGLGRAFRSFISFLRRFRSGSSSESSRPSINRSQSHLGLVSSSLARRRSRAWVVEEGNGISGW